jgi:hypothetical protein
MTVWFVSFPVQDVWESEIEDFLQGNKHYQASKKPPRPVHLVICSLGCQFSRIFHAPL